MSFDPQYPDANTSMLACLHLINRTLDEISTNIKDSRPPLAAKSLEDLKSTLFSLVTSGGRPSDYFGILSYGAFKECYYLTENWVIKFAASHNNTSSEKQVLECAASEGLSDLFLETIFIDLPRALPSTYLSSDGDSFDFDSPSYTYDSSSFLDTFELESPYPELSGAPCPCNLDTLILQPRAIVSADLPDRPRAKCKKDYEADPLYFTTGYEVPFSQYSDSGIRSLTWLQNCINTYGDNFFISLCDFIDRFLLGDLHCYNIGYLGGRPIILDWISQF